MLLFYLGMQLTEGYGYLGLGPSLLTASNHIYVSSVHTPGGVGDNLISTSVTSNKNNSANAAKLNGAGVPGPTTLTLKRNISVSTQEIMLSINKVF